MPTESAAPWVATYRVQLTPDFGFDDAGALAAYLAELGVSHLYTSPYLQAAPGSTHGYDVVDHNRVNAELGGERWHRRMCDSLRDHGLGHVVDLVPNHMAISPANRWWWDVLENGRSSVYARYFDVDWDPPESKLRNTVLMPILADHYGRVLEAGDIRLVRKDGSYVIEYLDHVLPVHPPSMDALMAGSENAEDAEKVVAEVNADPDRLDALLDAQHYRLAFWRTASRELDYRRFFDITELIGLRVEDPDVFADTHALVLEWMRTGAVQGLRVDHPDGLRDPAGYLQRLHEATGAWTVVEKILEPGEHLRATWPVAGTTGYEFLNRVGGLFVDAAAEGSFTATYQDLTGEVEDFPTVAHRTRMQVMATVLAADVTRLTHLFAAVCEGERRYRDYTRHELGIALREVIARFDLYRTYVVPPHRPAPDDVAAVERAVGRAKEDTDVDMDLLDFLADVLLLRVGGELGSELAARFQQLTGPVMAKGVEDTAFYVYNRFVALNEVGGDPARFGTSVEEFHRANAETQRDHPLAMVTTSTHDTKRSEDVRARLAVLSEIPGVWRDTVQRWMARNDWLHPDGGPGRNLEYLLYQSLVGAWPLTVGRASAFALKAAKEAKQHTSWTEPNAAYDDAVVTFVERLMADDDFTAELDAFVAPLVTPGRINSLAMQLLKLTSPGVPDIYQGTELWDLSLVDPDNRRPVDYARRKLLLSELDQLPAAEVWGRAYEGLPKLLVTRRALDVRRRFPDAFGADGTYTPLEATGGARDRLVAFARGDRVITVVPRLQVGLTRGWEDTVLTLPNGVWTDELTGRAHEGPVSVTALFEEFPVSLLSLR
ncbi:MAG TPA: malto-oligosyltrehalose synthase [Acidimicrobiales bacterium]|nr:malto-oligosyltrehalose synthase [Acidimicrobiales bacterium]